MNVVNVWNVFATANGDHDNRRKRNKVNNSYGNFQRISLVIKCNCQRMLCINMEVGKHTISIAFAALLT